MARPSGQTTRAPRASLLLNPTLSMTPRTLSVTAVLATGTLFGFTAATASAEVFPWQLAAHTGSLTRAPQPAGQAPIVCVVDTGVDLVPSVAANVVSRFTLLENPDVGDGSYREGTPASGHGTYVAQTIAQTWPHARIVSVRIGDENGALANLYLRAVAKCRAEGASVVNLSLGAKSAPTQLEQERLAQAIDAAATNDDVDVVAAAGNNPGPTNWPAAGLTQVGVPVGAFDNTAHWCSWASRGPEVFIGAPGCDMETNATHGPQRMLMQGSSFAAPQVAAVLAAVHAYAPNLTAAQRRVTITGLVAGMLDGDEILRRIGRPELVTPEPEPPAIVDPAPTATMPVPLGGAGVVVPAPATTAPATKTPNASGGKYFTTADEPDAPRLTLTWKGKRLVVRASYAPRGARLGGRIMGRKKPLTARGGRLTVPAALSKPKTRIVVRLISGGGKTLATRSFKAARPRS